MSNLIEDIVVIVPSYEPDEKLLHLLHDLREAGFAHVLVVNDGSSSRYDDFFRRANTEYGCPVERHHVNLGKGRALKTAFNRVLNDYPQCIGAITVDSDGQHRVSDTINCCDALREHPDAMIFGVRSFLSNKEDFIPLKNRLGNILTSVILKTLTGIAVSDTQTGLRAFSRETLKKILPLKGERFEYEMNMLIETRELGIKIIEVPIQTVYIDDNASSHFNKILDSARIYSLFAKFLFVSLSSFVLDITLFSIFVSLLKGYSVTEYILFATLGARLLSATYNFEMNRKQVFKSAEGRKTTLWKYVVLAALIMLLSALGVRTFYGILKLDETITKVFVDLVLMILSFQLQREWVFKKN
ncbi:MAG TPA: glycosyl transferase [Erysipelotrichaceae bacterium]|nr:bifunctional glycosyltransferase family 2/GtrA family protein [Erysipelotrichaceae bacterium]HAO61599.1 glycosyl transferase [Erysipelotrichaceae bacterium]